MPTEVSKSINAELYPDLAAAGSLSAALQQKLDELSPGVLRADGLSPKQFIVYAVVRRGSRSSQLFVAAHERGFSVDFWHEGVQYGSGWTSDLGAVARAVIAFQVGVSTVEQMTSEFPWFQATSQAAAHQRSAEQCVAGAWRDLIGWLSGEPADSSMRALLPVVIEAASRPLLGQLLPFTSMEHLCFSRTTGYPFTDDCPVVFSTWDNHFVVLDATRRGGRKLGEGDAAHAADLLVANLPDGCGPARHGTAKDE